jgi:uncharacterized membrane protein (DUF2068 family)
MGRKDMLRGAFPGRLRGAGEVTAECLQGASDECNGRGVDFLSGSPSTDGYGSMDKSPTSEAVIEAAAESHSHEPARRHDRGLLLIGLFKLGKSLLFFCIGVGVIHMLHKDLGDEVLRIAARFNFDSESRVVALLLEKVDLIDAHRLREIGFGTFAYSALALTEGIGLLKEKEWAEYLTLILTISFLPWELYELARRPDWFRVGILITNLLVLAYLVWLLRRKKQKTEQAGGL